MFETVEYTNHQPPQGTQTPTGHYVLLDCFFNNKTLYNHITTDTFHNINHITTDTFHNINHINNNYTSENTHMTQPYLSNNCKQTEVNHISNTLPHHANDLHNNAKLHSSDNIDPYTNPKHQQEYLEMDKRHKNVYNNSHRTPENSQNYASNMPDARITVSQSHLNYHEQSFFF